MPWFYEDDYESFRRILPERRWHPTYGEWHAAAEQTLKRFQNQGVRAIKAHVRSDDFIAWCRASGRDIHSDALVAFANECAVRAYLGDKGH